MSSYKYLSSFYDELCENVEYEARCDYISNILCSNGIIHGTILDLACGTGGMSVPFAKKGYKIIGIDLSEEMLEIASKNLFEVCDDFTLLKSNMRDFSLTDKVDACICCLDSINHLNSPDEVSETFKCVFNSLKEDGLFIFDVNTVYKHQSVLADNTFVFDEDDYYLVWDNELLDDRTVRILIDIFCFNGSSYDRFNEEFCETAYTVDEIKYLLTECGFSNIKVYDELCFENPKNDSERIYFVCKKG